jgi:hypothetical protein
MNKPYTLLTERQKTLIVNNVLAAVTDINKLNNIGYHFLYLSCGFIAHYNRYGFINYYSTESLRDDIITNAQMNQWNNFHLGDRDYDHQMEKKEIYNRILVGLGAEYKASNWLRYY